MPAEGGPDEAYGRPAVDGPDDDAAYASPAVDGAEDMSYASSAVEVVGETRFPVLLDEVMPGRAPGMGGNALSPAPGERMPNRASRGDGDERAELERRENRLWLGDCALLAPTESDDMLRFRYSAGSGTVTGGGLAPRIRDEKDVRGGEGSVGEVGAADSVGWGKGVMTGGGDWERRMRLRKLALGIFVGWRCCWGGWGKATCAPPPPLMSANPAMRRDAW